MKKFLIGISILLALSLSACGKSSTTTPSPSVNPGAGTPTAAATDNAANTVDTQSIYKQNCMSCHGNNMEGVVGPSLQKVGSKYTTEQIAAILANGRGGMPAFKGRLTDVEISSLSLWLSAQK